ncbi:MAG: Tim44/TimA family putative adaptor protein [Aaplasma endosymbiont of Hyalomma asiaticum]
MVELAIYAFVAAFIFFRLYSSLGRASSISFQSSCVTPEEQSDGAVFDAQHEPLDLCVDSVAEAGRVDCVAPGIESMRELNAEFSLRRFMSGSSAAFEVIMKALNAGDTEVLRSLLTDGMYESFNEEIARRKSMGRVHDDVVVSIMSQKIFSAVVKDGVASITVKFITEQINIIRDLSSNIIDGDASKMNTVEDIWTFEKDARSPSHKWYLAATS